MSRLLGFYNQNRKQIWTILISIASVFLLIFILNYFSAKQLQRKNQEVINESKKQENIYNQDESLLFGEDTKTNQKTINYKDIIESFLYYCTNNKPADAYDLLSNNCKEVLYPTQQLFEEMYYHKIFQEKKIYNFQNWSGRVYEVRILEDILSTRWEFRSSKRLLYSSKRRR